MAVNIKSEPIRSFPCISINAMDDDKEKSYALQQSLLKKDIKTETVTKFQKELKVDVGTNNFQNLMEYREAPASPGASSVHSLDMGGMDNLGSPTTPSSPVPVPPQEMDDERLPNELLDEICEDIGMKEGMELDFVEFLMEQDMVDPQVYMTPEAIRNTLASVASAPPSSQAPVMSTPTPKTSNEATSNWQGRTCGSPSTTYSLASSTNCTVATSSGSSSPVAKRFHMSNSGPSSPVRTTGPMSPHGGIFKAPQTPPTPRRPSSTSQSIASPSISSTQGPQHSPLPQRPYSPSCVPSSPSQKSLPPCSQPPPQQTCHSSQQMAPPKSIPSHLQRPVNSHNFQRLGRPAPPNVNVQNMQQKWVGPNQQQNGMMGNQSCAMGNPHQQYGRSLDSPLDHGYYSGDTASVRSYGSSVTSTVPSSVSSGNTTIHNQNFSGRQNQPLHSPSIPPPQQKSVHFADIQGQPGNVQLQRQSSNDRMGYPPNYDTNIPDCDLENDFNQRNVPSKIMPRLTPSMKSEIAPYTVPGNNGAMSPYGDYSRNNNSRPGSGENPMASMQQYDYSQKSGDMFNVDNNQNSMHMNNFNNSMQSNEIHDTSYRPSCSGGAPIGMQPLRHYDGPECSGMQPTTEQMYMDETDSYKQTALNMGYCDEQYRSQNQNMNNSCSVMGMNQKINMPSQGGPQGIMDQNQGNFPGGNFCANPMQNSCVNNVPRSMHMHGAQMMNGPQGNMTANFDQNQYSNNTRMPPSANMNNAMYQNPQTPISASNMSCQNPGSSNQNWVGSTPQQPAGMHPKVPHPGMSGMPPQPGMQTPTQSGLPPGASPMPPCTQPNCQSCKTGSPHRPPMLASQQTFIQHLITDRSNAFRSHPLFPLLRDLIIADMNFSSPSFPYQLISNLPAEFDKLLQNFLHRNPPSGNYQGNYAVESVIMDALKYAHHCLIEKIRSRQEQDKHSKSTSKSLSAIEEFCEKFDRSVRQTIIKPATFQISNQNGGVTSSTMVGQQMGGNMTPTMGTPSKDHKFAEMDAMMIPSLFASPVAKKGLDMNVICPPHYKSLKDLADCSDGASMVSSSSNHGNKSESKKHPSLPKEAVAIMLEWLRQHKDNPYPNDDEKAMLIKQTGLTINQINYWFTNARRRILPKWAQQCK